MAERIHTDGRVARGERTRRAVVDAHTELLREGALRPTAREVADRAGIALRTLWSNFTDREGLLRATSQHWLDLDAEVWVPVDPDQPLADRIALFCARRVERVEHLAPAARSGALGEPFSPALRAARAVHVQRLVADVAHTFGPEIGPADGPHATVHRELYVLAAWPTWRILTEDLGMTRDQAREAMTDGFRRVLAAFDA